ncbi:hypothetical protein [Cytobacillus firmus]|uniref:hypothetical protein n=1 Tax=Cytobacillus firmus TaxID=1399 RepID=UPI0018CD8FEE|nr:hypothetical protein [Cytobacillus firmus]MBG9586116.1 hypothetical protein [Cytobacillus firmus]
MRTFLPVLAHVLAAFLTAFAGRKSENKQDRKLYFALMVGGFVWSQLQTEYLIWRINKNTDRSLNKSQD